MNCDITVAKVASLLKRTPKRTHRLLRHEKINMGKITYDELLGLLVKYRQISHALRLKGILTPRFSGIGVTQKTASKIVDQAIYGVLYSEVKERYKNKCAKCSSDDRLSIHHKDFIHSNMIYSNLILLCWLCHSGIHNLNQGK